MLRKHPPIQVYDAKRGIKRAQEVASSSKDTSRQVGCVIVDPKFGERVCGYNSFPRGIRADVPARLERPAKYSWTVHDLENAVCLAARLGVSVYGCTVYTNTFPCSKCARMIIQTGIAKVVTPNVVSSTDGWAEDQLISREMLQEAHIEVVITED